MPELHIDVWSDIACPWCYVGKRRLEAALAAFPRRDAVAVTWRAFQLDPSAPRSHRKSLPYAVRLARKYGGSVDQAEQMLRRMTEIAAADGLDFHFEKIRPGNTFDAHRLLQLASLRGKQDVLGERLFRAYLTEGEPIGEPAALARLAADVGLDPAEVQHVLAGDAHADAVRADEAAARRIGIRGVPFFMLAGRHVVSGAQPSDVLLGALRTAWDALPPDDAAGAAVCGPDGCD